MGFSNLPVVEIYTKADLRIIQKIPQDAIIMKKDSIPTEELIRKLSDALPEGEMIYDPDFYTDSSPEELLPDIIRAECFSRLRQEIPHSLYVRVEDVEDDVNIVRILAYVVVETDSQKKILIGKNASVIQEIGTEARKKMEELYEKKVFLQLRATVEPNWTKNQKTLKSLFPHA